MANSAYMAGRKKYGRPQAMLWADNPGTIVDGAYIPVGNEVGSDGYFTDQSGRFIILSDDNRQPIDFKPERIETRERMINGRMRSYHIADKLSISASWQMLPSRSHFLSPEFQGTAEYPTAVGKSIYDVKYLAPEQTPPVANPTYNKTGIYTTDGGAGGAELLEWYENNPGSFWVYLSYDKYPNFSERGDATPYDNLAKYSQIVEVFFSDFSYTVEKRGGTNYDFWNISVTLEEV
jgi:hypothetical protein